MPRTAPAISLDPKTRTTLNRWVQAPSTAQARDCFGGGSGPCEPADRLGSGAPSGHGGKMAAVVCDVRIGRVARCAALGAAAKTRCRGGAESADLGLPAAGIAGTLDGAHVGAKGGSAAQHGSRDAGRIAVTTTPHPNLHLQSRPGVRAEIIGHRGVVFEPTGECLGAVCRRKAWNSGA